MSKQTLGLIIMSVMFGSGFTIGYLINSTSDKEFCMTVTTMEYRECMEELNDE